ncbi:hypothetical protein GCM10009738_67400 [Kitasatospora viridis]
MTSRRLGRSFKLTVSRLTVRERMPGARFGPGCWVLDRRYEPVLVSATVLLKARRATLVAQTR